MKLLATYFSLQEAYIVKGMLDDNGIPSAIVNENNLYVPVLSGVRVMVNDDDYERARQLLTEHHD